MDLQVCNGPPSKRLKQELSPNGPLLIHPCVATPPSTVVGVADLPFEVLEGIFVYLPVYSLGLCRLVCRFWNSVISNPKNRSAQRLLQLPISYYACILQFLCWKKSYYQIKLGHPEATELSIQLLKPFSDISNFAISLVRMVDERFSNLSLYSLTPEDPLIPVYTVPLYSCVSRLLNTCPELIQDSEDKSLSLQACVALLAVLGQSVEQMYHLITALTANTSNILSILELMHFLCCIFYLLWRKGKLPQRLHFNIFHAIAVFERPATTINSATNSLTLTPEQLKILNHKFKPQETIKIVAFAGTGKTTTLMKLVEANPTINFLYAVFNKSMVLAAQDLFRLPNVHCRTFHSIAYTSALSLLKYDRAKLYNGSLETYHLLGFVDQEKQPKFNTKWLLHALERFFASDDDELSIYHVPEINEIVERDHDNECVDVGEIQRTEVFKLAKLVWGEMINKENEKVLLPHDGYLKLFQLRRMILTGYNCLLIDEAQDITPAIKSIVDNQELAKVFVGDPHQQIYSFRGAINALRTVTSHHTFYLTQSFRFGPRIAYLTSCVLDLLKGVHQQTITGTLKQDGFLGVAEGQVAFIARTNSMVFEKAIEVCKSFPNASISFTSSDTTCKKELNVIKDIYRLFKNEDLDEIKNKFIRKQLQETSPYRSFKEKVIIMEDSPLLRKLKLVERYSDRIMSFIEAIESNVVSDWKEADFVFSTTHKAKGLEFDTVVVCEDFIAKYFSSLKFDIRIDEDEKNMLYVAITRAKKQVIVTRDIVRILSLASEHLMYCMCNKDGKRTEEEKQGGVLCVVCGEEVVQSVVHRSGIQIGLPGMYNPIAAVGASRFSSEGPVCKKCAGNHMPFLKAVL